LATTWLAAGCHYDPGPTPKPWASQQSD